MNVQKLFDLIKANEEADNFYLSDWFSDCGTYGCLVGNYCLIKDKQYLKNILFGCGPTANHYEKIAYHFDIPYNIAIFLFSPYNYYKEDSLLRDPYDNLHNFDFDEIEDHPYARKQWDRDAAINRIRKYLYYHLHKREMELDERGVKESARNAGSWDLMDRVKKELVHV